MERLEIYYYTIVNRQTEVSDVTCFRYGVRVTTEECPMAVFVMSVQSIVGVIIQVNNKNCGEARPIQLNALKRKCQSLAAQGEKHQIL